MMKRFTDRGEREHRILAAFFAGGLLAGACSSDHLLGSVEGSGGTAGNGSGLGGQAGFGGPVGVDAGYPGDASPLGASQLWTGYLENFQFPSGSDAVKLSFATDPTGDVVVGTVTFGAGSPPPPATDPDAAYPPGATQIATTTVVEGFPYTIARGTLVGSRLRFTIWETEVWSGWCALQTQFPGSTWCLPNGGTYYEDTNGMCSYQSSPSAQTTPVNCTKLALCTSGVCACESGGCTVTFYGSVEFDMALSINGANGSITGQLGDHNIRLTQSP
jgi:hypothetical protein